MTLSAGRVEDQMRISLWGMCSSTDSTYMMREQPRFSRLFHEFRLRIVFEFKYQYTVTLRAMGVHSSTPLIVGTMGPECKSPQLA